jgi:hypothetical protein
MLCSLNLLRLPCEQVCLPARDDIRAIVVPSWLFYGRACGVVDWVPLCGCDGWSEEDAVGVLLSVVKQVAGCRDNSWQGRRCCGDLPFDAARRGSCLALFGCDAASLGRNPAAVFRCPLHRCLLAAAAVCDGHEPWLGAGGALRVLARLLPVASPAAWRRDLVHLHLDDFMVHIMVGLYILEQLVRAMGAHLDKFLGVAECAVPELCLLVGDILLSLFVAAGPACMYPCQLVLLYRSWR